MKLTELKVNDRSEPLGIDCEAPVFSFRIESDREGIYQEQFRITVEDQEQGLVWDSGFIQSSRMTGIVYKGSPLRSSGSYKWRVESVVTTMNETILLSGESGFETALLDQEDWKGCFIGETADHEYHIYRKVFVTNKKVIKARLFLCGLGHFDGFLNGMKITDSVLEPGWSDYRKTCFYSVYDVTEHIQIAARESENKNVVVIRLGDGMFHVPGGKYVYYERSYGRSKLLFQLELTAEDGTRELILSDESWKRIKSPVRFCCIYGGEEYDARYWKKEFLQPDYKESEEWKNACRVEPPEGRLRAMPMESVKIMQIYEPVRVIRQKNKVLLYDLGKNFSGWVRIRLKTNGAMSGRRIRMIPGELLRPDGTVDQHITGNKYCWIYTLSEEKIQEFAPDFTYTGFRYVSVEGVTDEEREGEELPFLISLRGEFIYTDLETAGEFYCSNPLFQTIHEMVKQAILSNTKSYFTDCPHREKLGWLEQTHLIGPSIMYNLNAKSLYRKVVGDMADAQRENGLIPDICPEYVTGFERWHEGFVDSPEWGSAVVLVPWYYYKRYGDRSLLETYYPVMKRYVSYLTGKTHHNILHHGLGDWLDIGPCTPHSQNTPISVVATCIYYKDLIMMQKTAALLGDHKQEMEYDQLSKQVFREYQLQFFDAQTGRYANGSQTAQAMSLMAGLVPEKWEKKVVSELVKDIRKRDYAITAGDIGHPDLIAALMKYRKSEIINKMTKITDHPGYGFQAVSGATSLTEEWDGPDPASPHGSQNHLMLGSIEEWFFGGLLGVELIREELPFGQIRISPQPPEDMEWAKGFLLHPYGKIHVEWEKKQEQIHVRVQVPPNLTAHLMSPWGTLIKTVGSGVHYYYFNHQEACIKGLEDKGK